MSDVLVEVRRRRLCRTLNQEDIRQTFAENKRVHDAFFIFIVVQRHG